MDDINMQKPEVPVIIIERDEQPQPKESVTKVVAPSWKRKWLKRILAFIAALCCMAAVFVGYQLWNYYYNIGVSVSVTPEQNIEKLQKPVRQEAPEVVMTSDSILGVAMDFYAIHGLKASIEFEEPDTADTSVYLYCRSADHKADSTYIGSLESMAKNVKAIPTDWLIWPCWEATASSVFQGARRSRTSFRSVAARSSASSSSSAMAPSLPVSSCMARWSVGP